VSLALYGTEEAYALLRLLTSIETLLWPDFYDKEAAGYCSQFKADYWLYHSLNSYQSVVSDIATNDCYSDMHAVLALSAVVQKPIRPDDGDPRMSTYTKLVTGRDVQTERAISILWTSASEQNTKQRCNIHVDHFVSLIARVAVSGSCLGDTPVDSDSQGQDVIVSPTTVSADDELDSVVLSPARDGNPLNKRFMPLTTCLQILRDNSATLDSVPTGVKENVWFKVKQIQ